MPLADGIRKSRAGAEDWSKRSSMLGSMIGNVARTCGVFLTLAIGGQTGGRVAWLPSWVSVPDNAGIFRRQPNSGDQGSDRAARFDAPQTWLDLFVYRFPVPGTPSSDQRTILRSEASAIVSGMERSYDRLAVGGVFDRSLTVGGRTFPGVFVVGAALTKGRELPTYVLIYLIDGWHVQCRISGDASPEKILTDAERLTASLIDVGRLSTGSPEEAPTRGRGGGPNQRR